MLTSWQARQQIPVDELATVITRVCALWLVIVVIRSAGELLQVLEYRLDTGQLLHVVCFALPGLLVAVLLWKFPLAVFRTLWPTHSRAIATHRVELATCVLGAWLLAQAITGLVALVAPLHDPVLGWPTLLPHQRAVTAANTMQLILGAWLLLGSLGRVRILR